MSHENFQICIDSSQHNGNQFFDMFLRYNQITDFDNTSTRGINRIREFCSLVHITPELLKGKIVVDIGGGTVRAFEQNNNCYYPWYSIHMGLIGAKMVNIDKPFNHKIIDTDKKLKSFLNLYLSLFTHIPFDLSKGLKTPKLLIDTLQKTTPDIRKHVALIHCNYLISFDSFAPINSPQFKQSLHLSEKTNVNVKTRSHDQSISRQICFGIFNIADNLLQNQGFLHFNNTIFQKRGDVFVLIPTFININSNQYRNDPLP